MAKRPAPVSLTGGIGFNYEDHVAARFLVDLLGAIPSFGADFGHIIRLDWQVRDSGRLLDDLTITFEVSGNRRCAEISIKSNRQVTAAGFPNDFVETVWEEWMGEQPSTFQKESDLFVLICGEVGNDVLESWNRLLRECRATSADRMLRRLKDVEDATSGSQSSATERALFKSLACPESRKDSSIDESTTFEIIRRLRLFHYDFGTVPSRDEARGIADCQRLLRAGSLSEAKHLWDLLVGLAAENRGVGGYEDLASLLSKVSRFDLEGHPNFLADWKALERSTHDVLAYVRTDIAGNVSISRDQELLHLATLFTTARVCLATGDSGCGKSALAKTLGNRAYGARIAITPDLSNEGSKQRLEQSLGIRHSLIEALTALREPCLVIFDSMERSTVSGLRLTSQLIAEILADKRCDHVHVLLITQSDAVKRIVSRLDEVDVHRAKIVFYTVSLPPEESVQAVVNDVPGLAWSHLHQDMQPLLRNLKILDWVVRASRTGDTLDTSQVTSLPALIDYLWDRWIEVDHSGIARGGLLKKLATLEASTMESGIPLTQLQHSELMSLGDLISDDLLRRQNERIRFLHDLLGDWARLKVLVGEDPTRSSEDLRRAADLRWHRGVRLFGRWLLAQTDGTLRWSAALNRSDCGSEEGAVVRDLLLESIVLSENAYPLLSAAWEGLLQNEGRLLRLLLDRFQFVATAPDFRLFRLAQVDTISPALEVAYRMPLWQYWGAFLKILDEHNSDVCRIVPLEAARISRIWLNKAPLSTIEGNPFPWRLHAARIAVGVAREMQARHAEGGYFYDRGESEAFEAVLLAADDLPDEIAKFTLEVASRRPLSPTIQMRAEVAHRASEEILQRDTVRTEKLRLLREQRPIRQLGSRRDPWPDGPRQRVIKEFREAVLDGTSFIPLCRTRMETALEVLLAVCIEEPGYEDPYGSSMLMDRLELESWQEHEPAMYFRGPFLQFFRICPQQGVEFITRLVNFATARWKEAELRYRSRRVHPDLHDEEVLAVEVTINVDSKNRIWSGDHRVYQWHLEWPGNRKILTCALMAFEQWLYEQIDAGSDIDCWLNQLMIGSESVAIAGLLVDIGKRKPAYFLTSLRPLLGESAFYFWERKLLLERGTTRLGLMGWWNQPSSLVRLAGDWHGAEHRRKDLSRIAVLQMLNWPEMENFFAECRRRWQLELNPDGEPRFLLILSEQLNRQNYQEVTADGGETQLKFAFPSQLEQTILKDKAKADQAIRLISFPMECRQILDREKTLEAVDVPQFWAAIVSIANEAQSDSDGPARQAAAVSGGLATLLRFHSEWIEADEERQNWCFNALHKIATDPPLRSEFDCRDSVGEMDWDCFISQAAVCLLEHLPEDPFVKDLVANGVMSFHFGTTKKTMCLAHELRSSLGVNFELMQHLAIQWAVVSRMREQSETYYGEVKRWTDTESLSAENQQIVDGLSTMVDKWSDRHSTLAQQFMEGTLEGVTLLQIMAIGSEAAEELETVRFPDRKDVTSEAETALAGPERDFSRRDFGIDERVLRAAFSWMDVASAASGTERQQITSNVRSLTALVVDSLSNDNADRDDFDNSEIDDLPNEFDGWVFGQLSRVIVQIDSEDSPSSLWLPILRLNGSGHRWTERFFWHWFTDGIQSAPTPEVFAFRWSEMLTFALESKSWSPSTCRSRYLDNAVFELLGYHFGLDSVGKSERFAPILQGMIAILEKAAQRWFVMPKILNGFTRCLSEPAYRRLLGAGIQWIKQALDLTNESRVWRERDFDSNLIAALNQCWEHCRESVIADRQLHAAFSQLLTVLTSNGNHAAASLRDRLLDSIPMTD